MMKEVHKFTFIFGCGSNHMLMLNRITSGFKIQEPLLGTDSWAG